MVAGRAARSATTSWPTGISPASTSPVPPSVFNGMWSTVGQNIASYRAYPRIVGETGGKDFILAHPAPTWALAVAIVRGAFEYQGQKCSAASRAYIPSSPLAAGQGAAGRPCRRISMGDSADFSQLHGRRDRRARPSDQHQAAIDRGRQDANDADILAGGGCDDSDGYFVQPTLVADRGPEDASSCARKCSGPVVTVYVYPDARWDEMLATVDDGLALRPHRRGLRQRPPRRRSRRPARCATPPATSTSTTSPPARWWASSPSAAPAPAAPTTRPAPSSTCCAGSAPRTIKETFVPATRLPLSLHAGGRISLAEGHPTRGALPFVCRGIGHDSQQNS